jgi:hypothetical protein
MLNQPQKQLLFRIPVWAQSRRIAPKRSPVRPGHSSPEVPEPTICAGNPRASLLIAPTDGATEYPAKWRLAALALQPERALCKQEVTGSIPVGSINDKYRQAFAAIEPAAYAEGERVVAQVESECPSSLVGVPVGDSLAALEGESESAAQIAA